MKHQRVGDLIKLQRRRVDVDPLRTYEEIGLRSFGRGIFHKEPVEGAALGNKRVFAVCPGDLIFSNVFAWEGAVALASPAEEGKCGSHRFMTYTAKSDDVDLTYLSYFFTSELGLTALGVASPGSAGRNRTLAIERFENLKIPLPGIVEQRRIVSRVEALAARASEASIRSTDSARTDEALIESTGQAILDNEQSDIAPLGDVAEVNPRPQSASGIVAFVPMSAVDDKLGTIARPELKPVEEIGSGYKQFRRMDVIFARITPCMQNGKAAVMDLPNVEVGYGSTEFHVIRPGPDVLPEWIHRIVRSRRFRGSATERFTGTAGQQRVPAEFLRTVPIPLPSIARQRQLIARIDRITDLGTELRLARAASLVRMKALEKSILNAAFNGLL